MSVVTVVEPRERGRGTILLLEAPALGNRKAMTLGTSIFLFAVGAILRYAVTASTSGVSLPTIGLILMIVGIVGAVLSLLYMLMWSESSRWRRGGYREPGYREPPPL